MQKHTDFTMKKLGLVTLLAAVVLGAFFWWNSSQPAEFADITTPDLKKYQVATFAGGCFWCVESGFEKVPGVKAAISGYSGGKEKNPTYHDVGYGLTGHTEAVQVYYDAKTITYQGLVEAFWRMMDPTDNGGQFKDRGSQYRPAIFYRTNAERKIAEKSKANLAKNGPFKRPITIEITRFSNFYPAETYHQDYYKKNPIRYKLYTQGSGRAGFVLETWSDKLVLDYSKYRPTPSKYSKPDIAEIKRRLTPLQFDVTQNDATERPFNNAFWNEKRKGIYVDIVSGEPLFSSKDKFKSGTGWPSFTRPIRNATIINKIDKALFTTRVEVRSQIANSHLGHVFDDGPAPTGKRYCINSASLRFIPVKELVQKGYKEYLKDFSTAGM
jgi:peptide methionine sulfoxide reductase msrA/msrB